MFHGQCDVRVENVPEPEPSAADLVLEVHAAGICGTDLSEYVHGPRSYAIVGHSVTRHVGPLIPGHEFSGRVVSIGADVSGFELGSIVATGAGISCGDCFQCLSGRTNLCLHYTTVGLHRHGGLAQYCAVAAKTCLDVSPYGLDEETAALAQPMAIAVHSLRRGRPSSGDAVVVFGAGGIGAFLIYAAAEMGARIAVVDIDPLRLAIAQRLGAAEVFDGRRDLRQQMEEINLRPMVVYEVTGVPAVLDQALSLVTPGGRLVVVGLQPEPHPLPLRELTLNEIEVIGTNAHACSVDLPEALRLLGQRGGTWSDLAPAVLPLDELVSHGLEPMARGDAHQVKTLIDPWATASRGRV